MFAPGWFHLSGRQFILLGMVAFVGCQTAPERAKVAPEPNPSGRAQAVAAGRLAQDALDPAYRAPGRPVPVRPMVPTSQPSDYTPQDLRDELPDPVEAIAALDVRLADPAIRPVERDTYERLRRRVSHVSREQTIRLSLADAIHRALLNNYQIQYSAYNPAIEATRIVEAESQFDSVFFTNFNWNDQDRPSASQLQGTLTDTRVYNGGIRKLLSTGTRVQASYALTRTKTNLSLQTLNPSYFNQFIVEFQQPLLRSFGLDFNRAQIELRRLDRRLSVERLERDVRETIFNVEQAYWRLLQARRSVVVQARLIVELEGILQSLRLRADYDVYAVQLNQTQSRIELVEAGFLQRLNVVRQSEVALKSLLNDPGISLAQDAEIIPTDVPSATPLMIDQLGEVTAALTHRSELREARLAIEAAQIAIGAAKNQALPRFDLLFRYIIDGLGSNPDQAFSQLSENDFNEYVVGLEFEWPIGNRGPEAALRRARLQQAQAIAGHRSQIEQVISEVKQTLLDMKTNYEQIGPNFRSARASRDQLIAIRAKQERRDPPSLQVELDANQSLAAARQQLLSAIADYNVDLINLERRKGTLLRYNNIVIRGADDETCQKPYGPTQQ